MSSPPEVQVAVIGGGVVGAAVSLALARRGVDTTLLEAEAELALGASGTNSGILHTGFDSKMDELETELILRAAALREPVLEGLGIPVVRCGAVVRPGADQPAQTVAEIVSGARANGVEVSLGSDGALEIPGESVTDPVAFTLALAAAAGHAGAELRTNARVAGIERVGTGLALSTEAGERLRCDIAVNCAGLGADDVARLAGDESFEIYPRKGEFFVFEPPGGKALERILLPAPTKRTKGVLIFPTTDGKVIAGPTAIDQADKRDWSVRDEAFGEVMAKAVAMLPALEGADPIAAYAGLRPAGRACNYLIGPSAAERSLINVAAIRSTGLTASLGIAEHVVLLLGAAGIELGDERVLPVAEDPTPSGGEPWWRRAARARVPV